MSERVLDLLRVRGEERQVGAFFDTLKAVEHPYPPPDGPDSGKGWMTC